MTNQVKEFTRVDVITNLLKATQTKRNQIGIITAIKKLEKAIPIELSLDIDFYDLVIACRNLNISIHKNYEEWKKETYPEKYETGTQKP